MAKRPQILIHAQFGKDRFASNAALSFDNARCGAVRQEHIDAAAKTDQTDAVARHHIVAFFFETDDAACYKPSDLRKADTDAV